MIRFNLITYEYLFLNVRRPVYNWKSTLKTENFKEMSHHLNFGKTIQKEHHSF